jgi:hypothetical protein
MNYKKLLVTPEICSTGIWDGVEGMIEFKELELPHNLQKEFEEWINYYDIECHKTRHFLFDGSKAEELNKRGRDLALNLKKIYPDVIVAYRGEDNIGVVPDIIINL